MKMTVCAALLMRKRCSLLQRKVMRQRMLVIHLKQGYAAKSYCLNGEKYFDKQQLVKSLILLTVQEAGLDMLTPMMLARREECWQPPS